MSAGTTDNLNRQTDRQSGIELLKVLAIFFIILSHVLQKIQEPEAYFPYEDYLLDFGAATTQWRNVLLALLRCGGAWGNMVFLTCSAWFLLDSKRCNMKKWTFMLVEAWVISMIFFVPTYMMRGNDFNGHLVVRCLAPTIYTTNSYLTCYLMFYLTHPLLNKLIEQMEQKTLFRASVLLFTIYFVILFLKGNILFGAPMLLIWLAVYFVVAYVKYYPPKWMQNAKQNAAVFVLSLAGQIGGVLILNGLGLCLGSSFEESMLYMNKNNNPFLLLNALTLFQMFRGFQFHSKGINGISSLSLLIYLIHGNILLRSFYRPMVIRWIYQTYGYTHILLWVFAYAVFIFVSSALCSWLFKRTMQKPIRKLSTSLHDHVRKGYLKLEERMLSSH